MIIGDQKLEQDANSILMKILYTIQICSIIIWIYYNIKGEKGKGCN